MGFKYSELPPHIQKMVDRAGHPAPTAFQPKGTQPNRKVKGVQNGAEKDFYVSYLSERELSGEFVTVLYEGTTLPLAHRCTYTPDFDVRDRDGVQKFYEVKAPHRFKEKGVLKLKFAAQSYPQAEFYLAEKKKGEWKVSKIPHLSGPPSLIPLEEDDE